MTDILKGLNKEQLQAVQNVQGPAVILAGAGSGKTRVLIHKVLNLIQNHNVNPHQIVMITFTNKA
ncbi:MAG: UvrD-helicase domain-containing protein, partial [Candidatus Kaiserbacteria bacterium]|nr:UvrD-helicase domain-containing protein [Candidatus Kaiserbacteria bacterium]